MSVLQFPTGHVHHDEPMSEERARIVEYLEWVASVDIGSVLTPDQRLAIEYAGAWIKNRLDRKDRELW